MIVKDKEKVSQPIDASLHYKMYKDGKHWVTAGITTLMFSGLILGMQTTAHADTATASTSGNGQAQATTGGNAVTQTTAQAASTSNANLQPVRQRPIRFQQRLLQHRLLRKVKAPARLRSR